MLAGFEHKSMALLPDLRRENWMDLFLLSLLSGGYILFVVISFFLPGGINELEEMKIFILGWLFAPVGALLSVPLFVWASRKQHTQNPNEFSTLLFTNVVLFQCLTSGLNLLWQFTNSFLSVSFSAYAAVIIIPVINLLVFCRIRSPKTNLKVSYWALLIVVGMGFANFLQLFPYFNYLTPLHVLALSIAIGFIASVIKDRGGFVVQNRHLSLGIDLLVIILIVLTCFDPAFSIDKHSQDFYLGPVNRILHGGPCWWILFPSMVFW